MAILSSLLSAFVPTAHAFQVSEVGAGAIGIDAMWQKITSFFPYSSGGALVPNALMGRAQGIIIGCIAGAALIGIAYAGLRLVSGGISEEGIAESKKIVKNVIIGLILAILSDGIILFVMETLWNVKEGVS